MALTKTTRTLIAASTTVAASATVNATEWDLRTAYGGLATVTLSLPGSAPTVAPTINFYVGEATGKKRLLYSAQAGVAGPSSLYPIDFVCEIPVGVEFVNISVVQGASGNSITAEAWGQEITSI